MYWHLLSPTLSLKKTRHWLYKKVVAFSKLRVCELCQKSAGQNSMSLGKSTMFMLTSVPSTMTSFFFKKKNLGYSCFLAEQMKQLQGSLQVLKLSKLKSGTWLMFCELKWIEKHIFYSRSLHLVTVYRNIILLITPLK